MEEIIIYQIKNLKNNKIYIGCSKQGKNRFYHHKSLLKRNKHCNKHLQNAWNKYGAENFEFIVTERCTSLENMFKRERELIDLCENCYNIAQGGYGGDTFSKLSEEEKLLNKKKKSEASKKYTHDRNPFLNKSVEEKQEILKIWSECKKGSKNGRAKYFYKVAQINKNNNVTIKIWDNIYEIDAKTNFHRKYVINCCLNKHKSHGGFIWKFI